MSIFWLARFMRDEKNDPQKACFVPDQMMLDIIRNIDPSMDQQLKTLQTQLSCWQGKRREEKKDPQRNCYSPDEIVLNILRRYGFKHLVQKLQTSFLKDIMLEIIFCLFERNIPDTKSCSFYQRRDLNYFVGKGIYGRRENNHQRNCYVPNEIAQ